MVSPTTGAPCRCSRPATTELSTPPDMATAMGATELSGKTLLLLSQFFGSARRCIHQCFHLLGRVVTPEREPHARARVLPAASHGQQNVRGFDGAAAAGRAGRD